MGCYWRLEVQTYEVKNKDTKKLMELFTELDESGADWDNEWITLNFNASYSFSIKAWAEGHKEILKQYPGLCFYLYCEEREPDESFEVSEGLK